MKAPFVCCCVVAFVGVTVSSIFAADGPWMGTWATSSASQAVNAFVNPGSPTLAAIGLMDQTVRQVVPTTIAGTAVRLRFSNLKGQRTIRLRNVRIALQQTDATLKSGSNRAVTFSGDSSVLLPAGGVIVSDPVAMLLAANQEVSVSFHLPGTTGPITTGESGAVSYVASGDLTAQDGGEKFTKAGNAMFLVGLDVTPASTVKGSVAVLGDSLTAGGRKSWPGALSTRIFSEAGTPTMSVLNFAIAGVRLLRDSPCFGNSALGRYDEVLTQPNLKAIIVALGGNDIRIAEHPGEPPTPTAVKYGTVIAPCWTERAPVSAADLIAGLQQLAARAHDHGIKIYWTPITPFTASPDERAVLTAVNEGVRKGQAFDGIFDTATPCTDSADPWKLTSGCDVGDNMHFSPTGMATFAGAIDLAVLRKAMR